MTDSECDAFKLSRVITKLLKRGALLAALLKKALNPFKIFFFPQIDMEAYSIISAYTPPRLRPGLRHKKNTVFPIRINAKTVCNSENAIRLQRLHRSPVHGMGGCHECVYRQAVFLQNGFTPTKLFLLPIIGQPCKLSAGIDSEHSAVSRYVDMVISVKGDGPAVLMLKRTHFRPKFLLRKSTLSHLSF